MRCRYNVDHFSTALHLSYVLVTEALTSTPFLHLTSAAYRKIILNEKRIHANFLILTLIQISYLKWFFLKRNIQRLQMDE